VHAYAPLDVEKTNAVKLDMFVCLHTGLNDAVSFLSTHEKRNELTFSMAAETLATGGDFDV
jgi:hypothetical protein